MSLLKTLAQKVSLAVAGAIWLALPVSGQTYTTLVSFNGTNGGETTSSSSTYIQGPMVLFANGNFYGTTPVGGTNGCGVVFMMTPSGALTKLHDFNVATDGEFPNGLAVGNDGNFYGATEYGGANSQGTLFQITPQGACAVIYPFSATYDSPTGEVPDAPPMQASNGNLYGTVSYGAGPHSYSGIYQATLGGSYTLIHTLDFSTEGDDSESPLIQGTDGFLYGTCSAAGGNGNGTVFKTDVSGNVTVLHTFSAYTSSILNSDGSTPYGPLAEGSDGNYYGTTSVGGSNGYGTVFQVTSNGGFTVIHTFDRTDGASANGLTPESDGNFYGTCGGGSGVAAFKISLSGALTTLGSQLTGQATDGADPNAPFVQGTNGNLYGTTYEGGIYGMGTVFELARGGSGSGSGGGTPGGSAALVIQINGGGTVNPNDNGMYLTFGKNYTVSAQPFAGWIFSDWVASGSQSFVSNKAALKFAMSSNLVLQANFVANPFIPVAGVYEGLFMNSAAVTAGSSGSFKATVGNKGAFTANLDLAGQGHSFSGQFTASGSFSNVVKIKGEETTVLLQLDLTGNNVITGSIANGAWSAAVSAYRAKLYTLPAAQKYTLAISGSANSAAQPGGVGIGLLTVNTIGNATFSGFLADNTAVTTTASVSAAGLWPFYAPLYSGGGMIIGWLALTNQTGSDLNGALTWIEGPHHAKFYEAGFTSQPKVQGSLFAYANYTQILNYSNTLFYLSGGSLSNEFTSEITLVANEVFSTNPGVNFTINASTGKFQGTMAGPIFGGLPPSIAYKGIVLQKQNVALGYYLGEGQTGVAGIGSSFIGVGFGALQSYALNLSTAGTGTGSVTANPSASNYLAGTVVTVAETPASGSVFAGWLGAAGGTGVSAEVTMNTNQSVTAVFDKVSTNNPPLYSLTIGTAGSGTGTVTANPSGPTYTKGTVVTVTATPGAGSSFTSWADDASGTAPSVQITMTTNEVVTGVFDLLSTNDTYSLTVRAAGAGSGTVTADPPGPTYTNGTVVTLTETPDATSTFTDWSGATNSTATSVQITMTTNKLVTATFASLPTFLLTIETAGAGSGTVTASPPGPQYTNGTVVTLTAAPDSSSTFTGWSGAASGTTATTQITITTNETVVVTFGAIPTYTLTIVTAGNGTGTVTANPPGLNYTNGTVVTLTETPGSGSVFGGWSGAVSGSASTIKLTINGNETVTATFNDPTIFSGTWRGTFEFPIDDVGDEAQYNVVWVMTQNGNSVSGQYGEIEVGETQQVNGTLSDGTINGSSFTIWEDQDGLKFEGALSGNTISGSVLTGSTPGSFSVTKQ